MASDTAGLRRRPDPIALGGVQTRAFPWGQGDLAAVVRFVPADRVENKMSVVGLAVFQRLPGDEIVRELGHKARGQFAERLRVAPIGQAVTFQRSGQDRFIQHRLGNGKLHLRFGQGGQQHRRHEPVVYQP